MILKTQSTTKGIIDEQAKNGLRTTQPGKSPIIFSQELLRYMITQLYMGKQMFTWADKRDKEELGFAAWDGVWVGVVWRESDPVGG